MSRFVVATATVPGAAHLRAARNNQDGLALAAVDDLIVAIVTDGCSSAPRSEAGALMGARYLAQQLPKLAAFAESPKQLLKSARDGLLSFIEETARKLHPGSDDLVAPIHEFFLFSVLGAVITPERVLVFGLGDGVYAVNGQINIIDPGPDNAPPYLAYALVRDQLAVEIGDLEFELHYEGPASELKSLVISTDGAIDLLEGADDVLPEGDRAGGFEPFIEGDALLKDPALLQKRLNVLGGRHLRLRDDTTMVILRPTPPGMKTEAVAQNAHDVDMADDEVDPAAPILSSS
jgi:hypothetical protein